jgi:AbrB family looped-hinge helix DNA binding protein
MSKNQNKFTIKVRHKGLITMPAQLRRMVGISDGDPVKVNFKHGKFIVTKI